MNKLNFYTVDYAYVDFLKNTEINKRGFTRVPNMNYGANRKQKFLLGVVLEVNGISYYVPVTSYKQQMPDNFLILAKNGAVVSSLRFNYMFPIPRSLVSVRKINQEPDRAYRALLSQELRYCINNQSDIQRLAERTYKRVKLGKDLGLVHNSCDFKLLEDAYIDYCCEKGIILPMELKSEIADKKSNSQTSVHSSTPFFISRNQINNNAKKITENNLSNNELNNCNKHNNEIS